MQPTPNPTPNPITLCENCASTLTHDSVPKSTLCAPCYNDLIQCDD